MFFVRCLSLHLLSVFYAPLFIRAKTVELNRRVTPGSNGMGDSIELNAY